MIELKRIVQAHEQTDFSKTSAALATVVKVEGSSYRSPGAKMYILKNGQWEGSVSGGCLEGDVLRQAREVMETKIARIITYDTHEDSHHQLGVNLGCNGIIHIYLEPIDGHSPIIQAFRHLIETEKPLAMVKKLDENTPFTLFDKKGKAVKIPIPNEAIPHHSEMLDLIKKQTSGLMWQSGTAFFFECFEPAIDLLIVGGGGDAQPVAALANQLGWKVRLTDECAAHLFPKNFPNTQVIQCDRKYLGEKINAGQNTAAVLMTHNLDYDRDALIDLLKTKAPYIGIVGPGKRWTRMQSQLEDRGVRLSNHDLTRIHAPVGLDIGADTREEIALSIIAEIKAFFSKRDAASLKNRKSSIHDKDPVTGEVFKTQQINFE